MESSLVLQNIISILIIGSFYCLGVLGLNLTFSILHVLNFAHGEFYMVGAFVCFYCVSWLNINYFLAVLIAIVFTFTMAWLIERGPLRHLRGQVVPVLIFTLGLSVLFQGLGVLLFGTLPRNVPVVFGSVLRFWGAVISMERLILLLISLALIIGMNLFVKWSKMGKAMRAVAENVDAARLKGINADKIAGFGFGLGGSLAGASGALVAPIYNIHAHMGEPVIFTSLTIIILGGFGSIPGSILAAFILATTEVMIVSFLGARYVSLAFYGIILLVLLVKPSGLLGYE